MEPWHVQIQFHGLIHLFDAGLVDAIGKIGSVVQPHDNKCLARVIDDPKSK